MTPLMRQYNELKSENPDCILFFRLGDFYELFDEDAKTASKILGLTLTSRNNGAASSTPLCGFPYHAAERYIPKMIDAGYRVAICEQLEDPKQAKGLVKRGVVEIISAGTTMSEGNLVEKEANYLCAILVTSKDQIAFSFADVSTGFFSVSISSYNVFESEFSKKNPSEVLILEGQEIPDSLETLLDYESILKTPLDKFYFEESQATHTLVSHFKVDSIESLGLEAKENELRVAGALLAYLLEQKKSALSHITRLEFLNLGDYMILDPATQRHLELIRPLNIEDTKSTLNAVLDHTVTAMGGRLLKDWIVHPLIKVQAIEKRSEAIAELVQNPIILDELKQELQEILDIERLMGRVGAGRANARDLAGLGTSLLKSITLSASILSLDSPIFKDLYVILEQAKGRGEEILSFLKEDLPLTIREGGMIKEGASETLDAMHAEIKDKKEWMASLEAREKERLGITTLKVGFNKVFGYYIEVTKAQTQKVPEEYIRKQTTVNAERYITPQMKEYESIISNAEVQIHEEEYKIFCELREKVNSWRSLFQKIAGAIAKLDVLYSLSIAARRYNYCRAQVHEANGVEIVEGFHPVIVAANPNQRFVPNDIALSSEHERFMLITGPNMAGKSTYLRQTGLIVLMAQMGSFVPAKSAKIGIVDRIFTRVGASDRLSKGLSTFMVEMVETANILRNASPKSLILLDEIGRGTSTFDGLSIAWAIVETLHGEEDCESPLTLFATHYHELTSLIDSLPKAENYQVLVQEKNNKLIFLHQIAKGACDSSYGIHVAEMAGLPPNVVRRARRILHRLEKHQLDPSDVSVEKQIKETPQVDIFAPPDENATLICEELSRLKPEEMTPLEALQFLSDLKEHYHL
ncbi:MAG: DNA mismatch repair protein MutS [Fibrobacter sp.]|nr:DNA mismatch repair protein MutS [Fibrobacter sp.]